MKNSQSDNKIPLLVQPRLPPRCTGLVFKDCNLNAAPPRYHNCRLNMQIDPDLNASALLGTVCVETCRNQFNMDLKTTAQYSGWKDLDHQPQHSEDAEINRDLNAAACDNVTWIMIAAVDTTFNAIIISLLGNWHLAADSNLFSRNQNQPIA